MYTMISGSQYIDLRDVAPALTYEVPFSRAWLDQIAQYERWLGRMYVKNLFRQLRREVGLEEH